MEDGSQFISEFKNGIPLGKATILFANGDKITGAFTWFNGGKYIGSWKDDKRHGLGICIGKNLIHSPCEWKYGIAQSPRKNFP